VLNIFFFILLQHLLEADISICVFRFLVNEKLFKIRFFWFSEVSILFRMSYF